MPAEDSSFTDAEGLAEKIRSLAPQLTAGERTLLVRALAAAALFGVPVAAVDLTVDSAPAARAGATTAADDRWGDIRGQFAGDYTPGVAWDPPVQESIKPPGQAF